MKKLLLIPTLITVFAFSDIALAAYYIEFGYVNHRKYEDGRDLNRVLFSVKEYEDGPYVTADVVNRSELKLYDPNGKEVNLTEVIFDPLWRALYGNFDVNNVRWGFISDFAPEPQYYLNFSSEDDPLIQGTYHLHVEENDGTLHDVYWYFDTLVDLPMISSRSFRGYEDASGNFIWTWDLPLDLDFWNAGLSTTFRVIVQVYNNGIYMGELYVKQPTFLGMIIVSSYVMDKLEAEGDTLKARIQLRTNDQNNRTYSNQIDLKRMRRVNRRAVVIPIF